MQGESILCFGAYVLDPVNRQLWRGKRVVMLTDKALRVLCYLAKRPGQLVTKDELFQTVWLGTAVTDSALTVCIKEIRKALRDNPKTPQYIETVYRRGYRFLPTATIQPAPSLQFQVQTSETRRSALATQHSLLVGRETELAQLHGWLDRTLSGERQIVFVTGEAGIGKTTLVEAFITQARRRGEMWIGQGQCVEQYGAGEAYRPVLEALGRLCRESSGKRLLAELERHAPTWLVQMPALVSPARLKSLQERGLGATKERMLREMAEAIEAITTERPLILALEDLHWSDAATLELLAALARRQEAARLLVLGTYRPVEMLVHEHPLRAVQQELHLHGRCHELCLDFLSVEGVTAYLTQRFGNERLAVGL